MRSRAPDVSPVCSPKNGFSVPRFNAFKLAACCLSLGTGSLVTAFRSPTTIAASRRPPFRGQRSRPAASHPSRSVSMPVRPFGSATAAGLPQLRPLQRLRPVALLPPGSAGRAHRLHSPSGLLPPSGSKRSTAFAACRSTWRIRPTPFAPRHPFLFQVWGVGSPFRARYVSAGLLFLKLSYRVRLFSSLRLVVAPPVCEPGKDTSMTFVPRLHRLAPGQPPLLAVRLPGATGLASKLSGCFSFTGQRFLF
jgi:hypothetical protein